MARGNKSIFILCHALVFHCFLSHKTNANVSLYLPKSEVKDLFGVDNMQLYYIRNGVINKNAINFPAHVGADKYSMVFNWQSTYSVAPVLYDISFPLTDSGDADLVSTGNGMPENMRNLITLSASINSSGEVSDKEKAFKISIHCTGKKDGVVTVLINFKFTLADIGEETWVKLTRLKRCIKRPEKKGGAGDSSIDDTYDRQPNGTGTNPEKNARPPIVDPYPPNSVPKNNSGSHSTYAFYISISIITFLIFLAVIVVKVWHSRTTNKRDHMSESIMMNATETARQSNQFLRPDLPNNISAQATGTNAAWSQFTPIINDLGTDIAEIRSKLSSIAIPRSDIVLDEILHEGTFARLYRGTFEGSTQVLVKTITSTASDEQMRLLLFESSFLRGMNHKNLLPIKRVVLDGPEPPLVLFPYTKGGNLKLYLRDIKFTDTTNCGTLSSNRKKYEMASTQDLVDMGIKVACGMAYIAKRGLIHKDLATRNCVIDSDLQVKITDNALSKDLFPADYCCLGDNQNRPVRWLAMESLVHKVYSSASDVWSFGVLLWELQSLAATPYNDIDDFEMSVYLRDGFRLSQPVNCPDHLYNIMARCWHYSPEKRPTFGQLLQMLMQFYAELGEYV